MAKHKNYMTRRKAALSFLFNLQKCTLHKEITILKSLRVSVIYVKTTENHN